jgi:poly(3-hydroxybutyrate) depolymerase
MRAALSCFHARPADHNSARSALNRLKAGCRSRLGLDVAEGDDMLYRLNELRRALLAPAVHLTQAGARVFSEPDSWLRRMPFAPHLAAGYELMYRLGRDYPKPEFGIQMVHSCGTSLIVREETEIEKPFCRLLHFRRFADDEKVVARMKAQPHVLVVAPLSGHHATLLRDTVTSLLSDHSVYITDWIDARMVPVEKGGFSLDDYVAYVREFIHMLGASRLHVMAVCQPTVPVLAAIALMADAGEPIPRSLIAMGGPIDARPNPTHVNELAKTKPLSWFRDHLLHRVPPQYPGRGRLVYPGFLQHMGFIAMNPGRHMRSHWDFYQQLIVGDLEDAEAHRRFYDEYNAVLDMPAEYYIDCVRIVFQEYLLARGLWDVEGVRVRPEAIHDMDLLTIEGELDDISGLGQTRAAHTLCTGILPARKHHITVEKVGHYGIFSGRRWRESVYPQVKQFIAGSERWAERSITRDQSH